jgi:hypothetical protein
VKTDRFSFMRSAVFLIDSFTYPRTGDSLTKELGPGFRRDDGVSAEAGKTPSSQRKPKNTVIPARAEKKPLFRRKPESRNAFQRSADFNAS